MPIEKPESEIPRKHQIFDQVEERVRALSTFQEINKFFIKLKEKKGKDDPLFESNYAKLENTGIEQIFSLLAKTPNTEKISVEVQEAIAKNLREAHAIIQERNNKLLKKFDEGHPLSKDEKANLTLYDNMLKTLKREIVARKVHPEEKYKQAA